MIPTPFLNSKFIFTSDTNKFSLIFVIMTLNIIILPNFNTDVKLLSYKVDLSQKSLQLDLFYMT